MNRAIFFSKAQELLGDLSLGQHIGFDTILDEWEKNYSHNDLRWLAYILATAYHETAFTMQPITEYGKGRTRRYGMKIKQSGGVYSMPNKLYYGRGFVQLTWYENYEKVGKLLGIPLLKNPELALSLPIATVIIIRGMIDGYFTARRLSQFFNEEKENWVGARKIVNGTDKGEEVANYARKFYEALLSCKENEHGKLEGHTDL